MFEGGAGEGSVTKATNGSETETKLSENVEPSEGRQEEGEEEGEEEGSRMAGCRCYLPFLSPPPPLPSPPGPPPLRRILTQ